MANTFVELIWVTHILRDLHALTTRSLTLLCDNLSSIFLNQNLVSHKRAKQFNINCNFLRVPFSSGKLHTKCVPTKLQVEEIFTKSLPRHLFQYFQDKLHVLSLLVRLKGVSTIRDNLPYFYIDFFLYYPDGFSIFIS